MFCLFIVAFCGFVRVFCWFSGIVVVVLVCLRGDTVGKRFVEMIVTYASTEQRPLGQ